MVLFACSRNIVVLFSASLTAVRAAESSRGGAATVPEEEDDFNPTDPNLTPNESKLQKMMGVNWEQGKPGSYPRQTYFMCRPLDEPMGKCGSPPDWNYVYFAGENTGQMESHQDVTVTKLNQEIVYIDKEETGSADATPESTSSTSSGDGQSPLTAVHLKNIVDLGEVLTKARELLFGETGEPRTAETLLKHGFFPLWQRWLYAGQVEQAFASRTGGASSSTSGGSGGYFGSFLGRKDSSSARKTCLCVEYAPYLRHLYQINGMPAQHTSLSIGNTEFEFGEIKSVREIAGYSARAEGALGNARIGFRYLNTRFLGMVPAITAVADYESETTLKLVMDFANRAFYNNEEEDYNYSLIKSDCQTFVSFFAEALQKKAPGGSGLQTQVDSYRRGGESVISIGGLFKIAKNAVTSAVQLVTTRFTGLANRWVRLKCGVSSSVGNADLERIP